MSDLRAPKGKEEAAKLACVVFALGNEFFGLDIHNVREVLMPRQVLPLPKSPSFMEGVINLRGRTIGIIDLRKYFELGQVLATPQARIMIVRVRNVLIGLIVDAVLEVADFAQGAIEKAPEIIGAQLRHSFINGVARMNDRMVFILNIETILSNEEIHHISDIRKEGEIKNG